MVRGWIGLVFLISAAAPRAGGWRTIDLVTATCGAAAPGGPTFGVPGGYVVRTSAKGLTAGCLWGTSRDLASVLGESEATFDRVERGVFQARLTTTVEFDPESGRFREEGTLPALFERAGVAEISVRRRSMAGAPGLVVTGRGPNGAPLRLLYLGIVRDGGAEVLLVNFHAAVSANPEDETTWRRFLDSVQLSE